MARGNSWCTSSGLQFFCKASGRDQSRPSISNSGALLHCCSPRGKKSGLGRGIGGGLIILDCWRPLVRNAG